MLIAINSNAQRVQADQAIRGPAYLCPWCDQPVTLKQGLKNIHHFAHQPGAICAASGESIQHMVMKANMLVIFEKWGAHLEVPLVPGRRADVVVGGKLVIECQASPMSIEEWDARTRDYNAGGYPILWVWDDRKLGAVSESGERRISDVVRHCERMSSAPRYHPLGTRTDRHGQRYDFDSRVYALEGDQLWSCRLAAAQTRNRDAFDPVTHDVWTSSYTPTTLRHVIKRLAIPPVRRHKSIEGHNLILMNETGPTRGEINL